MLTLEEKVAKIKLDANRQIVQLYENLRPGTIVSNAEGSALTTARMESSMLWIKYPVLRG